MTTCPSFLHAADLTANHHGVTARRSMAGRKITIHADIVLMREPQTPDGS